MNSLETIKNDLRKLKPELSSKFYVDTIGLFGSVLRSDFSEKSDIDIIVEFKQPVGVEFIDLADFLESKFQRRIDLVSRRGIKPNYFAEIQNDIVYV
ncbi:MAG: nucleotidyltransferase family protein [Bacteroidetes bacterium]|nr:nucleotidyltransferase family protein [Bacteroidota bacterium]